ncbi:NADH-quinone oxidoreductase subunit D [Platysternon megacephalum]|uniref:sn-1-specific diacylglycerol lipase ABHD11 n=1 Tax=Platysternon megacephalum TaxID=55544 RepID=A0A4D9DI81_9SAUR|nr:NADH-quinone oxidoreductase subunit D [Platysternon megacephalum]
MPHHGRSPWHGEISYIGMGEQLAQHLETAYARDIPVILVGHSMGGKAAMHVALTCPELVAALVVVDISPKATNKGGFFRPIFEGLNGLDLTTLENRTQANVLLKSSIPDDTVRAFLLQNLHFDHHAKRWYWQLNLEGLTHSIDAINDWPEQDARTFDGPVLWIAGAESDYIVPEDSDAMRALFPRVRKVAIKGAGHWVHSEQPAAFTATLRAFCDAVSSSPEVT